MREFYFPDYDGGSTINLMSSIAKAFGGNTGHKELKILKSDELKSGNVVLFLIDGFGYEFLKKFGKDTIFERNLRGKMTTVFPSSTSAAITAINTGLTPQEHGMTGWHMHLKELGTQIIPLPFIYRLNRSSLSEAYDIKKLFRLRPFYNLIRKGKAYNVMPEAIAGSDFTLAISGKSKRLSYGSLDDCLRKVKKIAKLNGKRKFIFVYYPIHDDMSHDLGVHSKQVKKHFNNLAKKFEAFSDSLKKFNTKIIVAADHGEVDIKDPIYLDDHPKLRDMLVMPLCGEIRFAYAYVKSGKSKDFEKYVRTKFKKYCKLYKSEELIKKGVFGKFKIHDRFRDRIGDYVLIARRNYGIIDKLANNKDRKRHNVSDHGGLTKEELFVPLIFIDSE